MCCSSEVIHERPLSVAFWDVFYVEKGDTKTGTWDTFSVFLLHLNAASPEDSVYRCFLFLFFVGFSCSGDRGHVMEVM
ncbi:hypothetical protein NQZ68_028609 [Dissostichus eleginoides]|nr:hypothetical protein NQZ68_028609 [Dissostichus eleginoides]